MRLSAPIGHGLRVPTRASVIPAKAGIQERWGWRGTVPRPSTSTPVNGNRKLFTFGNRKCPIFEKRVGADLTRCGWFWWGVKVGRREGSDRSPTPHAWQFGKARPSLRSSLAGLFGRGPHPVAVAVDVNDVAVGWKAKWNCAGVFTAGRREARLVVLRRWLLRAIWMPSNCSMASVTGRRRRTTGSCRAPRCRYGRSTNGRVCPVPDGRGAYHQPCDL